MYANHHRKGSSKKCIAFFVTSKRWTKERDECKRDVAGSRQLLSVSLLDFHEENARLVIQYLLNVCEKRAAELPQARWITSWPVSS